MVFDSSTLRDMASYFTIMFQILESIGKEGPVVLQRAVHLHSRFKAEQSANIGFGEPITAITLESNGLEGGACRVLPLGDDLAGKFVRNLDCVTLLPVTSIRRLDILVT